MKETLEEAQGYICPQTKIQCDDECCVSAEDCHIRASIGILLVPKEETLEEAAILNCQSITHPYCDREKLMFIKGARWMEQRMYTEEDMRKAFETGRNFQLTGENNFKELIEQLKK